jgi:heme a synthase
MSMSASITQTHVPASDWPGPAAARPIRLWLWFTALLVLIMVSVGGATRLTGSGLSITEWRPVTGALPPLSEMQWQSEFEKYRQIPQYDIVNKGMTLAEFKFIYWWEWGHRQLGRFIGLVYLVGFLIVLFRRMVGLRMGLLLFGMGCLLGLQGFIGWIMVASGLKEGMTAVAPVKLTLHLGFASLFLMSLVAVATALTPARRREDGKGRVMALVLLGAILAQILLGGLVAGSRAGFAYNTWPLMDGAFLPPYDALFPHRPLVENFVDSLALVQFNHRLGAYLVLALGLIHLWMLMRSGACSSALTRGRVIVGLVLAQTLLGIVTLLLAVPLWAGLAHQALAMLLLSMSVVHAVRVTARDGSV